jgi:beta-galactosidase
MRFHKVVQGLDVKGGRANRWGFWVARRTGGLHRYLWLLTIAVCCGLISANRSLAQSPREMTSFDASWRFHLGDAPGAELPDFVDSTWQTLDVPHDWAIHQAFSPTNPSTGAGAFAVAGKGWYRKHFMMSNASAGRRVFIEFDGVMANSDVWVNGAHLGHRPYGYVSFRYELTGHVHFGDSADNVIAVCADNTQQPSSRWYEGAGIYRHVRLVVESPLHLEAGTAFITTPVIFSQSATVHVEAGVLNQGSSVAKTKVRVTLLAPSGKFVATEDAPAHSIRAGDKRAFHIAIHVPSPLLWDLDSPRLYSAQLEVLDKGKVVDAEVIPFGIREAHFEAATGFWLNGRNLKLNGVALHSDVGALGVAAPLAAWEHRLAAMRAMGVNAIRTAHNPVAPEFLSLCDRLGFLVMDEFFDQWTVAKNKYDYHLYFTEWHLRDAEDTIRRDRNHPSIILYSAGNEIHDTPNAQLAKSILGPMVALYHRLDPTRPVTQALFRPNASHDYDDGLADMLDVIGQNYRPNELLAAHDAKPSRKIVGTENIHDLATWLAVRDHPAYSGMFVWSGTDYLGESRHWPLIGDASGLYDRTDAPKPDAYERESWWSPHPVLHIVRRTAPTQLAPTDPGYEQQQYRPRQVVFHDWTPVTTTSHDEAVEVYSRCEEVELFLNERSLGLRARNADDSARKWTVTFVAGTLRGVGRNHGKIVLQEELRTAGVPVRIELHPEQTRLSASFDDVAYVRAEVVDANGTVVSSSRPTLTFSVTGPGEILATDNAENVYESPFGTPVRTAYMGSAIVMLRAHANDGNLQLRVSSPNLQDGTLTLPIGEPK